jgi:FkbH-like protein
VLVFIDADNIFGDFLKKPYFKTSEERGAKVIAAGEEIGALIQRCASELPKAKFVINNLMIPFYSPMGPLECKQKIGFFNMLKDFNIKLEEQFRNNDQIYVFDYDLFTSRIGKEKCIDRRAKYLADVRIPIDIVPKLSHSYVSYMRSILGLNRKCVVLDLDNTLWGGVLGEDGLEKIALGPTPTGYPYSEFQIGLLNLYKKGIILAINSKNNLDDVMIALENHPYMVLREECFAAIKANWNDKVSNMREIATELNIGLDSMVFLDDDPINREMMRKALPQVLTLDLPNDAAHYLDVLENLTEFDSLLITEEDENRPKMYTEERKRREFKYSSLSLSSFLEGLELEVKIEQDTKFNIPRITQLTLRTNQFNLTTKRYQEKDILAFSTSPLHQIYALSLRDRFGDYGLVGVIIVEKKEEGEWDIDTFLLSCRAMGRNVEYAFFNYVVNKLKKMGARKIIGVYKQTGKNAPVKDLYQKLGFTMIRESSTEVVSVLYLESFVCIFPKYIKIEGSESSKEN